MATSRPSLARGFIAELDGLRGVAILLVIVHRFWPGTGTGPMADAAGSGWIGVDLFFVISGFLIAGILLDTRGEPGYFKNFYARRVLRIFPLYYLFVVGVLIAFWNHAAFRDYPGSQLWYLAHLGNMPEAFGQEVPYFLGPVWSLAIEEQFYLTFPLLVAVLPPRHFGKVLVGMIVAAPALRVVTMLAMPEHERFQYLFTLCRLDTIAVGCGLALLVRRVDLDVWRPRLIRIAMMVAAVAAVFAVETGLDRTTPVGRTLGYSVVAFGCAALVLLVVLHRDQPETEPLRFAPLAYLGKLCFGIYLLHRPADTILDALAARAGLDAALWIMPLKVALAVALATLSWRLIEQPFLRLKDRFASARHPAKGELGGAPAAAAAPSLVQRALRLLGLASLIAMLGCRGPATLADGQLDAAAAPAPDAAAPAPDASMPALDAAAPADAAVPPADAAAAPSDAAVPAPDAAVPALDAAVPLPDAAAPSDAAVPPSDAADPPPERVVYREDRRHSPITPALVAQLQAIAAAAPHRADVFAKVGDSITASSSFATCFDGASIDLGANGALAPTISLFRAGDAAGSSPFGRPSVAAIGGWTAADALAGNPNGVERESTAIDPRFAVIMLGTNDVRYGRTLDAFGADLWAIIDLAIARGVIPLVSTIPPIDGEPGTDARIPTFNRVIRAIAQGRGIPLVDYHRELLPRPGRGLSSDGLHPSVAPGGACELTATALQYGYNVRNLITIEVLARARAALAGDAADASAPMRAGAGTPVDPFRAELPLADLADTRTGQVVPIGCSAATGRAVVYQVTLPTAARLSAVVVDRDATNVDVHIFAGSLAPSACVATGDLGATAAVAAGTAYIVVSGRSRAVDGEVALVVTAS